jgi:flagellum-specific ATP synthase
VSNPLLDLARKLERLARDVPLARPQGHIVEASPSGYVVEGLSAFLELGSLVEIDGAQGLAEAISIDQRRALVRCYDNATQARLGTVAWPRGPLKLAPHVSWRGRVIDAMGRAIDGGADLTQGEDRLSVDHVPPAALTRKPARTPLRTGIRVIDAFTPLCRGQRIGIFAGSGVGKSTLLGMMARAQGFDAVVTVLVGERGREVREFVEAQLSGQHSRMISVVATGDESAMMRKLAPRTGMRIAEYFRDRGESVLLVMDSVTRFAHAARDIALAAGEAPVARGFPPGVFSELPQLLERAGPGPEGMGDITGIFSVLVDGDDHNDPVADAIRSTLDGHIVLDRRIAEQGRYPAVNLTASISRLAPHAWSDDQRRLVRALLALTARFEEARDLVAMGGHHPGADQDLDRALTIVPKLYRLLQQSPQGDPLNDPFAELAALVAPTPLRATSSA